MKCLYECNMLLCQNTRRFIYAYFIYAALVRLVIADRGNAFDNRRRDWFHKVSLSQVCTILSNSHSNALNHITNPPKR